MHLLGEAVVTRLRHEYPRRDPTGFGGPVLGGYRRWSENYNLEEWKTNRTASDNIQKQEKKRPSSRKWGCSEYAKTSFDIARDLERKKEKEAKRQARVNAAKKLKSKPNGSRRHQRNELFHEPSEKITSVQNVISAEKAALRRFELSENDRFEIGLKSSGWSQYTRLLTREFSTLRGCRIHGADQIASVWNKKGFKTGAGRLWTPRLVKIAKSLLDGPTGRAR